MINHTKFIKYHLLALIALLLVSLLGILLPLSNTWTGPNAQNYKYMFIIILVFGTLMMSFFFIAFDYAIVYASKALNNGVIPKLFWPFFITCFALNAVGLIPLMFMSLASFDVMYVLMAFVFLIMNAISALIYGLWGRFLDRTVI